MTDETKLVSTVSSVYLELFSRCGVRIRECTSTTINNLARVRTAGRLIPPTAHGDVLALALKHSLLKEVLREP